MDSEVAIYSPFKRLPAPRVIDLLQQNKYSFFSFLKYHTRLKPLHMKDHVIIISIIPFILIPNTNIAQCKSSSNACWWTFSPLIKSYHCSFTVYHHLGRFPFSASNWWCAGGVCNIDGYLQSSMCQQWLLQGHWFQYKQSVLCTSGWQLGRGNTNWQNQRQSVCHKSILSRK